MKLGEAITLKRGYDLPLNQRTPGPYPIITSCGVAEYHQKFKAKGPGVVTGRTGTLGEVFYIQQDFWPHNTALYVQDFKGNNPRFVFYLLQTLGFKLRSAAAAIPTVNRNYLHLLPINLPPLWVQERVGQILCKFDDLIENNHRRIQLLEEMARALYREWFMRFRFPGHEDVEMVDSELGAIPKGWNPGQLGDIAEEVRRNINPTNVPTDTPYVGLAEIPRRSIALSEWGRAEEAGSSKLQFRKGEILFGKIRPYFHKVVVAPLDGICSGDTIVIVPKAIDMFALSLSVVNSDDFVAHATASSKGTKMPRADWDVLVNYPVIVPETSLLRRFNSFIENLVDLIQTLVFMNRSLQHARNLLLPRLVSGAIDVSELDVDIPISSTHKTSKYDEQSIINQWLNGDEEDGRRK